MAYGRTSITSQFSDNSDFSDSEKASYTHEPSTPVKHLKQRLNLVAGAAQTVELGNFTTITSVIVANLNTTTTNYTTVTFASADIASCKQRVKADDFIKLCDVLPGSDLSLTALTDNQNVEITVIGTA